MDKLSEVRRRPRVQTINTLPSKTVQSDVLRTDIRHILAKYKQVGMVEHMREVDLQFRDVTEFSDFADLMFQTKQAEKVFMALPSKVREVFSHDVAKWLDAAHDSDELEALRPQLEKLGMMKEKPQPDRRAPVVKPLGQRRAEDGRFVTEPPKTGAK